MHPIYNMPSGYHTYPENTTQYTQDPPLQHSRELGLNNHQNSVKVDNPPSSHLYQYYHPETPNRTVSSRAYEGLQLRPQDCARVNPYHLIEELREERNQLIIQNDLLKKLYAKRLMSDIEEVLQELIDYLMNDARSLKMLSQRCADKQELNKEEINALLSEALSGCLDKDEELEDDWVCINNKADDIKQKIIKLHLDIVEAQRLGINLNLPQTLSDFIIGLNHTQPPTDPSFARNVTTTTLAIARPIGSAAYTSVRATGTTIYHLYNIYKELSQWAVFAEVSYLFAVNPTTGILQGIARIILNKLF